MMRAIGVHGIPLEKFGRAGVATLQCNVKAVPDGLRAAFWDKKCVKYPLHRHRRYLPIPTRICCNLRRAIWLKGRHYYLTCSAWSSR